MDTFKVLSAFYIKEKDALLVSVEAGMRGLSAARAYGTRLDGVTR